MLKHWLVYKLARDTKARFLATTKSSLRVIISTIRDHYCDRRLGIKTSQVYRYQDNTSLYKDAVACIATPYLKLEKMVDYLRLSPTDIFIDIGCGKGRVLALMARQKAKKIIGIDLNLDVVGQAKENIHKLKSKNTPIEIINIDAIAYEFQNETVLFMYHPFGLKTFEKVIANIRNSLIANPRKLRLAYYGGAYDALLNKQDWLIPKGEIANSRICLWESKRVGS